MKKMLFVPVLALVFGLAAWAKCDGDCCKKMMGDHGSTVAAEAAKVKDPVCGMEVDPAKAEKIEKNGKTYYFCSKNCKEKFEKNPAQYMGQAK